MTLYEKNIKLLGQTFPGMDRLIDEAYKKSKLDIIIYQEEYQNERVLKIEKDGKQFYLNGKRDTIDPAKKWMENIGKLYEHAPIIMVGIGNVTFFRELVEKTENQLAIFVYEPSIQIFVDFLEHYDLSECMKKHVIVFWVEGLDGMTDQQLEKMLGMILKYETLNLSRRIILPNYDVLFPEETLKFIKMCREVADLGVYMRNTEATFSAVNAKNLLANLKYVPEGYKTRQFAGKIADGIPGILVAAGPSLNKNIIELKNAVGKAFIVATDTALKPLLREGILPDLLVIVDGLKPVELFDVPELSSIPLLCTVLAASEVLDLHKGNKIFCDEGYALSESIMSRSEVGFSPMQIGGSVATFGFSFLYMIGVKTIILVGQDLAYTNNRSHADGTFEEKMPEIDTSEYIMVEGNDGERVPTSYDFKFYLEWYEKYIKGFKEENKDFRVINATEGGAKIKGTEIMTLKEALSIFKGKNFNFKEVLDKTPPMLDEENQKWAKDYISHIPNLCRDLCVTVEKAKKQYKKLDKICKRKNIDTNEYLSILKKLDKLNQIIEKNDIYDLVKETLTDAQYILKNEAFMEYGSLQEEGLEIARKGILYMNNIIECCKIFIEYMKEIGYYEEIN